MNRFQLLTQVLAKNTAKDIKKAFDAGVVEELAQQYSEDALISGEARDLGQYLYRWSQRAKGSTIVLLAVAGVTLGAVPTVKNSLVRLALLHCSLGCILVAKQQKKTTKETLPVAVTIAKIQAGYSSIQLAQLWTTKPVNQQASVAVEEAPSTLPYNPELFDWSDFRSNPDSYPHIMVLGKTGSGKSKLTEWLLSQLGGKVSVITPHYSPQDWKGFKVIGGGRDFTAIAEIFTELVEEMDRRYELYNVGRTDFESWSVGVDEIPAIMASEECSEVPNQLKQLIRESRKVKIRLLLLTQGSEVATLKVQGEGSIRESLTFIRLGGFATDHAKKLKDEALLGWLKAQKRPCLIEDVPAVVPNLS